MSDHSVVSKVRRLAALREEIHNSISDYWLFPEMDTVQGFMGAGPVMFVAERPSTGHFPSPSDKFLYGVLEKYGVADSHLTDLIKSRAKVDSPYPDDIALHSRIFDREVAIVQPRLIIAFGPKVYDRLHFSLAGSGITIRKVWHYARARWGAEKKSAIDEQIREVLEFLRA